VKTLVFWGDAAPERARERARGGATVLLWKRHEALAGDPAFKTADLDPVAAARVERAVARFTARLGERPIADGQRLGDRVRYEDASAWPLIERFFLGPDSAASRAVRLVEAMTVAFETELPDEVEAEGLAEDERVLLERCCTARGVLFHGHTRWRGTRRAGRSGIETGWQALRSWLGAAPPSPPRGSAFVVWSDAEDSTLTSKAAAALRAVPGAQVADIGGPSGVDPAAFVSGEARDALKRTERELARLLEGIRSAPAAAACFSHEDVVFSDLCMEPDFDALFGARLPAAFRRAEGLRALVRRVVPPLVCAAATDVFALAAARVEKVPAVPLAGPGDVERAVAALRAGGARPDAGAMVG
jgi:hypothetical protein